MSSVLSQRGYYQHPFQITNSASPYEVPQHRNLQYSQPITENLYTRTPEARKYKFERIQEHPRIENGSYYPQIIKRGTLEKYESELNDRVVFPGPTSHEQSTKNEGPKITEECKKRGFCNSDEVLNYPNQEVSNLVVQLGDEVKGFQMDVLDDEFQIAQRLGGSGEQEVPLCEVDSTIIYPKSLPDKNDKWWYVLNQDDKPLQGFVVEMCKNENKSCNPAIVTFAPKYKSACKQKHVFRMVEALEDDKKTRVQKLLRLPGCCSCIVTVVNDY